MAERYDHRHDRAKPIERLVTIGPGTLGAFVLAYLGDLQLRNYSRHTIRAARVRLRPADFTRSRQRERIRSVSQVRTEPRLGS